MDGRTTALSALIACRKQKAWSDGVLKEYIARDGLDAREAAFATRLCYGVLQNRLLLDYWIGLFLSRPLHSLQPVVTDVLRLAVYQLRFMDKVPAFSAVDEAVKQTRKYANPKAAGLTNAVLRSMLREPERLILPEDLSIRYSHPRALVDLLSQAVPPTLLEPLLEADNQIPETCLQVNTLKTDLKSVLAELTAAGYVCEIHPWLPDALLFRGRIEATEAFQSGRVFVQDAAANLAVRCAAPAPGMRVLDCCAAPGGKSAAAAVLMENQGELVSCDIHPHKISLIEKNAARLGISILTARVQDASDAVPAWKEKFDVVIADVPCSGLGVIRKKPDIRYKDLSALKGLPGVQLRILTRQADYVKPGGVLLYSTCTVLPRENEAVTAAFLRDRPDYAAEPLSLPEGFGGEQGSVTLLPCVHGTDGFYICKLRRKT